MWAHLSRSETGEHLAEALQACFEVFDDLFGEVVGLRQVVQVRQALVLEPENIEAGLVAHPDLLITVTAPASFGCVLLVPGRLALVPVLRVVAADEIRQVLIAHRLLLQRVVNIGAVVVVPDLLRPGIRAGFAVIEEDHIGLDPLRVEHAGRKTQNGVQVGVVQQLLADRLTGTAFEQHIVRHDNGSAAGGLEHRANVLYEIELFVGCCRPEILTVVGQVVLVLFALLVRETHGTLLAERRVREHIVITLAGVGHKRVIWRNGCAAVDLADVVQEHVHQAQAARVGDDLAAMKRLVLQKFILRPIQIEVVRVGDEVVGGQEETARAAGRVGDELGRFGPYAFDHGADEGARREILPGTRFGVLGVSLQQIFVNIAFDVGNHGDPLGVVDHVDEAIQFRRVLDLVLGFGEDLPQHARLGAECAEQRDVVAFEFRAPLRPQVLPAVFGGDANVAVTGRLPVFVGHLEEDQIGELLQVVAIADPVIAQGGAEGPDFGDDGSGVHI